MDQASLEAYLADLDLSATRFFATIDSTNEEAWRWIETGAPHFALVIADEQTAGRGRLHRRWVTRAGCGLAFSLVLRSPPFDPQSLSRLIGLGALVFCRALQTQYSLSAQIKWPNDILLNGRKAGGVLVEARWDGNNLKAVVIGIGINIAPESISPDVFPVEAQGLPATCVEDALGYPVDRMELLHSILREFINWFPRLSSLEFIRAWEQDLAYVNQWVELSAGNDDLTSLDRAISPNVILGKVIGLAEDGALRLQAKSGELVSAQVGEIHLRLTSTQSPGNSGGNI